MILSKLLGEITIEKSLFHFFSQLTNALFFPVGIIKTLLVITGKQLKNKFSA